MPKKKQKEKKTGVVVKPFNKLEGKSRYAVVPLKSIRPNPDQPRKYFDEDGLNEAVVTLQENGQIDEIKVTDWFGMDDLMIIDGERRWLAAGRLRWERVEVKIYNLSPKEIFRLSLAANFGRKDMTEIEEAYALRKALDDDPKLTAKALASVCGKSEPWLYNRLKYLKLHPDLAKLQMARKIPAILGLEIANYPKGRQIALYTECEKAIKVHGRAWTAQFTHREVLRIAEDLGLIRAHSKKGKPAEPYAVLQMRGMLRKVTVLSESLEEIIEFDERKMREIGGQPVIDLHQGLTNLKAKIELSIDHLDLAL